MTRRYRYHEEALETCRNALRLGSLVKIDCGHWSFGRRNFHAATINALIAAGEAVREGDIVRQA